jgi:hypothetical protein
MEDADMPSHYRSESLDEQFDIIKDRTDLSHVSAMQCLWRDGSAMRIFPLCSCRRSFAGTLVFMR